MKDHQGTQKKPRSFKGLVMLLFSLGAGAAGVYFSQEYIEGQVAQHTADNTTEEVLVNVVVPARSMLRGEIVYKEDLVNRAIPEQYVDTNTVNSGNYTLALGQRLDFDIDEGRPFVMGASGRWCSSNFQWQGAPGPACHDSQGR